MNWQSHTGPEGHRIPVAELDGGAPGPAWLLTGAIHGDEYEGPAAIRRAVTRLAETRFPGRVIALPVANPMAYAAGSRLTPGDQGNLNRSFPGDPSGTLTQRWAHWLWQTFMLRADRLIDLHAGGVTWEFEPLAGIYREEDAPLAAVMGLTLWLAPEVPGVLSYEFREKRGPALGCELGFGGVRSEALVERATDGLVRLVRGETASAVGPIYAQREVLADRDGEFVASARVPQEVAKGGVLGVWTDWIEVETATAQAPCAGRLLAVRRLVSTRSGDLLAIIGRPVSDSRARPS